MMVRVLIVITCPRCDGRGSVPHTADRQEPRTVNVLCPACEGDGVVAAPEKDGVA